MNAIIYSSTSESWHEILDELLNSADVKRGLKVHGSETWEFPPPSLLQFQNPRRRLINPAGRNMNLPFVIADTLDILCGENPGTVMHWNSNIKNWLNQETRKFDGHYGERIFVDDETESDNPNPAFTHNWDQLDRVYDELKSDPHSRRATVTIHNPLMENYDGLDVACTMDWQFLIRDGKLNMITHMRSEDLYIGFVYDTFTNQFIQELLAACLHVELGTYTHFVGSLHLYSRDMPKVLEIFKADPFNESNLYVNHSALLIPQDVWHSARTELQMMEYVNKLICADKIADAVKYFESFIPEDANRYLLNFARVLFAEEFRRRGQQNQYDYWREKITNEFTQYFENKACKTKLQGA